MSYAICTVAYGVPLTDKVQKVIGDDDPYDHGFVVVDGNYAERCIGFCGLPIFEFDECCDLYMRWDDFIAQGDDLTEETMEKAQALFNSLAQPIKDTLASDGVTEPYLFMVWHSS